MNLGPFEGLVKIIFSNSLELLVFGVIMVVLQVVWPAYKHQKEWGESAVIDIMYSFMLAFLTPVFYAIAIGFSSSLLQFIPPLAKLPGLFAGWPLALQLIFAIFLIDLVSYWRHRLMHTKWLWPIHAIHHSSTRINWLSTERFHVFNYFVTTMINTLAVQIFLGPEIALFGALFRRFYNFFIHTNVDISFGKLGYIFVSPQFHHWHHSSEPQAQNKNYWTFFSCIDWLFGTFYLPKKSASPQQLGIPVPVEENLWKQFLYPFNMWGKMFRK
jgi:sterol desaturase/sphingolipid hydroxylase (fatty acid hydroxylase superfamily)